MSADPTESVASTSGAPDPTTQRHTVFEDLQGLLTGTFFVALGLVMFKQAGLMTGGTVGLAFLAHYASGEPFGSLLFLINLPFYVLAWQRMGRRFTLKTMAAVSLLSILSEQLPHWLVLQRIDPLFAAIGGGLLVGAGFIILFRHQASLGGLNVVAQWCQEKLGWRAGHVQLALDACILLASWPWVDAQHLGLSVLAAIAMNFALAINHKPGRYTAF